MLKRLLGRHPLLSMFLVVATVCAPWLWALSKTAHAAFPTDTLAAASYGAVQVNVTATAVPAAPMGARNSMALVNLGPNDLYCGWDVNVTSATGFLVAKNGGTLSVDIYYDGQKQKPKLYCLTSVLQVSPADTRYMEVK